MRNTVLFALCLSLLGLSGCGGKLLPEGEVISLSLSGGHMARDSFYGYYLREKDGIFLLDANFWADENEVELEGVTVPRERVDELRVICAKYGFAEQQKKYRAPKPGKGPFVADAPMLSLAVVWENGARLDAKTDFGSERELRDFFEKLSIELSKGA
jgi:hypothetical protein